jgi:hypothetical protein
VESSKNGMACVCAPALRTAAIAAATTSKEMTVRFMESQV